MNNENAWTQGEKHHTLGSVGGEKGRDSRGWEVGERYHGEKYQI